MNWKDALHGWMGAIGWFWASSVTIPVLLFYVLPMVIFKQYTYSRRVGWVLIFITVEQSLVERKFWKHWSGWSGGGVIILKSKNWTLQTEAHELRHSWQTFLLGLLHPIAYLAHSIYIWLREKDKHPYIDNFFEKDARAAAGQPIDLDATALYGDDRWPWW